jgi:hypothetical protein
MAIKRDNQKTPILDLVFNVINGELPGLETFYKFGRVINLGVTERTIWTGSEAYTFPGSAQTMAVASTNSADKAGISGGAGYLFVRYLGSGFNEFTEIVSLNGLTPVDLSEQVLRINRARILSDDLTTINTGDIWIGTSDWTNGIPDNKFGHILTGKGQTYQGFYTVPVNKSVSIYDINITTNLGKESSVELFVRENAETFSGYSDLVNTLQAKNHYDVYQTTFPTQRKVPLHYSEKTDLEFRATGAAAGTDISVEWTMVTIDSSYLPNTSL